MACVEHSKDALHETEININPSQALEYLQEVAEEEPRNHQVYYQMATMYLNQSDYEKALRNIEKAIQLQEANAEYHYLAGKIYQKKGESVLSVKALLLAEKLGKKNQELYQLLAEEYLRQGEPEKARQAIDQLTEMNNSAEAYTLKGNIMLSLGDTAVAIQNFRKAINLDKTYPQSYISLADIHITRGNEEGARKNVNILLKLEPDNLDFKERKAKLLERAGQLDSATMILRKIAKERQRYLDYYALSNVYYLQGQYDSAMYMAEQAYSKNKGFLEAQMLMARSLDKQRKYQEAIAVYETIVAADSTFNLAVSELDNLKRKVAYLWRLQQIRQAAQDSARDAGPAAVPKKEIIDNQK